MMYGNIDCVASLASSLATSMHAQVFVRFLFGDICHIADSKYRNNPRQI